MTFCATSLTFAASVPKGVPTSTPMAAAAAPAAFAPVAVRSTSMAVVFAFVPLRLAIVWPRKTQPLFLLATLHCRSMAVTLAAPTPVSLVPLGLALARTRRARLLFPYRSIGPRQILLLGSLRLRGRRLQIRQCNVDNPPIDRLPVPILDRVVRVALILEGYVGYALGATWSLHPDDMTILAKSSLQVRLRRAVAET